MKKKKQEAEEIEEVEEVEEELSEKEQKKERQRASALKRKNARRKDKVARWGGLILLGLIMFVGFLLWVSGEMSQDAPSQPLPTLRPSSGTVIVK